MTFWATTWRRKTRSDALLGVRACRVGLVCVALFVAGQWPAAVHAEPTTRLSGAIGGRQYRGDLGERYALGYVLMTEAAWQPGPLGLVWSTGWGTFESERRDNIDETLYTLEMSFALRGKIDLGGTEVQRSILLQSGLDVVRASTPIPPEDRKTYLGPAVGAAFELVIAEELVISFGARYGVFFTGPEGITLLFSVGLAGGNP